jgi:hypothetical protein
MQICILGYGLILIKYSWFWGNAISQHKNTIYFNWLNTYNQLRKVCLFLEVTIAVFLLVMIFLWFLFDFLLSASQLRVCD